MGELIHARSKPTKDETWQPKGYYKEIEWTKSALHKYKVT